jgi:FtsZ-interacting cell division protein ZipA
VDNTTIILIVFVAIVIIGLVAWMASRKRHTEKLREKYGTEYDYTVNRAGDRRQAEAELDEREERVKALEIRPLSTTERDRFSEEWKRTQAQFVDQPVESVEKADQLIIEVMKARDFPMADFEQRAADISVLYPNVVPNYRSAHEIAAKNERGEADTEDLRQAMVFYRSLFGELLETGEFQPKEKTL